MLENENEEKIAMHISQILYTFVVRAEICTTFERKGKFKKSNEILISVNHAILTHHCCHSNSSCVTFDVILHKKGIVCFQGGNNFQKIRI